MSEISRRDLLKRTGIIAVGLVAPPWLSTIARADIFKKSQGGKINPNTVLIVCQLSGGNDGLNTIIPWADKTYYNLRPTIGIPEDKVLKLDNNMGLHPSLTGLQQLYSEGKVAIVQNVGYPNPNRSHFKSMDIWQSASLDVSSGYGWIGKHFDSLLQQGPLNPVVAIGLSSDKPRALTAREASIPCFASLADIESMVGNPDMEKLLRDIQGPDAKPGSDTRLIQQANKTALDAVATLNTQLKNFKPSQKYPEDGFGNGFKQIAQIVATSPQTRVIYFSVGGFDTHARQADGHAKLMKGFGDAVLAFQREIESAGKADNVVVLVFSEFGRRSYENASAGTDHGAAAPMMLIGNRVKGGLHGPLPNLKDLTDGDLKFAIDFRQVYATTLDQWMGGDSGTVLGQSFSSLGVFKG